MMSNRFELEQQIMAVWCVKEDISRLHWLLVDGAEGPLSEDELSNMLMALENILELRCQVLWDTFCKTYELDHHKPLNEVKE
jgi:hypothetical protein